MAPGRQFVLDPDRFLVGCRRGRGAGGGIVLQAGEGEFQFRAVGGAVQHRPIKFVNNFFAVGLRGQLVQDFPLVDQLVQLRAIEQFERLHHGHVVRGGRC